MGSQLKGTFHPCEDCALEKAREGNVNKKVVLDHSTIFGERLFFDISSPFTPTLRDKKHCLFVVEDSTGYAWSYVLKEKFELKNVILGLIKNLKTKYVFQIQYAYCDNAG